jgi:hypothetical protein
MTAVDKVKDLVVDLRKFPSLDLYIGLSPHYPSMVAPFIALVPDSPSTEFYEPFAE